MVLIIKAKFGQDMRRLTVKSVPSFEQLETVVRNLFSVPSEVSIVLRYEDEEKDLITISSTTELEEAISVSPKQDPPLLRLLVSQCEKQNENGKNSNNFESSFFHQVLQNPQILTQLMSCPEVIEVLQKKFAQYKDLAPMNDLVQMFNNLGVNANQTDQTLQQMRQQLQVFLQAIIEIPFVKEFVGNLQMSSTSTVSEPQMTNEEVPIHYGVICDNCEETIVGVRYKCSSCADYDLCEKCEPQGVHFPDHLFLQIKRPDSRRRCAFRRPDLHQNGPWRKNRCRTTAAHPIHIKDQLLGRFVSNVSVPDGTTFPPGQKFVKVWKMRNEGTIQWPEDTRLTFVGGDKLSISESVNVVSLGSGEDTNIFVEMTAPTKPGRYVSYWRLAQPNGDRFGQRVWVDIVVVEENKESEKEIKKESEMDDALIEEEKKDQQPDLEVAQEQSSSESTEDPNVQKLLELGFTDVILIRSLLQTNGNDFFKTLDDLFNLQN